MTIAHIEYPSSDGETNVAALMWSPEGESQPRGVVQIVHGMAEHMRRYDSFADFLVNAGFVVCGNEHVGHGASVSRGGELGHIPLSSAASPVSGSDILVEDVHALRLRMQKDYPGVPHVMFGHSMGSFIVRAYLARHGEGLAAAILCGTGQQPCALSAGGRALCHMIAAVRGERFRSKLIDSLGVGAYAKKIPNARTSLDWISPHPDAVDEYIADPLCGFMFTVGGYAALTGLTGEVATRGNAEAVPKEVPLLFISGEGDPVGDFGRGVDAAVAQYRAAGVKTVDERLYAGKCHEIVNRPENADVREDVLAWLTQQGL